LLLLVFGDANAEKIHLLPVIPAIRVLGEVKVECGQYSPKWCLHPNVSFFGDKTYGVYLLNS